MSIDGVCPELSRTPSRPRYSALSPEEQAAVIKDWQRHPVRQKVQQDMIPGPATKPYDNKRSLDKESLYKRQKRFLDQYR